MSHVKVTGALVVRVGLKMPFWNLLGCSVSKRPSVVVSFVVLLTVEIRYRFRTVLSKIFQKGT